MTDERVPCLTAGCTNTIQPATSKRNGGYCGPCAGKLARDAHEEYVRRNRRDVDLYAGIADPVEMLRIMHEPRQHDPLVNVLPAPRSMEQLYTSQLPSEAARVMEMAVQWLRRREGRHVAHRIAECLAAFTEFDLEPLQQAWIKESELWPSIAFRRARSGVRDGIIRLLERGRVRADHGLRALAWVGDDVVVRYFQQVRSSPRSWAKGLYIPPEAYAATAGWELVHDRRRELCLAGCVAMTPATEACPTTPVVALAVQCDDPCPYCEDRLVSLMRLDARDPIFTFLDVGLDRLDVLTCANCTTRGFVYAELDDGGRSRLSTDNTLRGVKGDGTASIPWSGVPVQVTQRRGIHAAGWMLPTTLTQIGGHPSWVQDVDYPNCCRCRTTMTFLGQLDMAQFPQEEGIFYAFLCTKCRVTATSYQQT